MIWFHSLPLWQLALLIVGICVAFAIAGVMAAEGLGLTLHGEDIGTGAALHAFVGVLFAVALGLIVVNVQSEHSDVEAATEDEASKIGDLYRNLDGLEDPRAAPLQARIYRYVDMVLTVEWPANAAGRSSEETWRAIDQIARDIIRLHPTTADAQVVQAALLQDINSVLDARRNRLFLGQQGIGGATWSVIALSAAITLGFACLFPMRRLALRLLTLSLMASMFGLMLFLVVAMDQPLQGQLSIQPEAFRLLKINLDRLATER